jgi:alpha-amylase
MITEKNWIRKTSIYEVNLRQYTVEGTFTAFEKELARLKDMGVETLWFMPITPISAENRKGGMGSYYACSDYTAVNAEFGTLEDFKALVRKAHRMGLKVILDWVANHTGWDHVWTTTHPDWYEKDEKGEFKRASGMDDIIELDFTNADMRKAMIEAMRFWVRECDIDGFRCDLAYWVEVDFWMQAKEELDKERSLFWLAEADPIESPEYMQVFDAAYTWAWMHKTEDFYKGHFSFQQLVSILEQYRQAPGIKAWFTSNHDENSWNGTEYDKYGKLAGVLAVFSCTWPGIPLIYSGQELPNMKMLAFFEKDPIDWGCHYFLHGFYKVLLQLKGQHPALDALAPVDWLRTAQSEQVLAYRRKSGDQEIIVLLNFTANNLKVDILDPLKGKYREAFTQNWVDFSNSASMPIEPWGYKVLINEI